MLCVTFLSPNRKVTKEVGAGEGGSGAGKRSAVAGVNDSPVDCQSRDRIARRQLASGQRLPYVGFFWHFSCRNKKSALS